MEIIGIYPPALYAVRYSGEALNIYRLTIRNLTDDEYLIKFFTSFKEEISQYIVDELGYERDDIEDYVVEANDQIIDLRDELKRISNEIRLGICQDFGGYFQPHSSIDISIPPEGGGASVKYGVDYLPVKCYGIGHPSLVRLYAIEFSYDCYLIIYGGIKIKRSTNDCPAFDDKMSVTTLESELRKRLYKVCEFLKENSIVDRQSLLDYMEEDHEED
ncbi:MAG: hypothetical protein K2H46_03450 [Muribaculaceae bacterium]|nr:hypothetical protein [Muribaculaceae bacterium]